MASTDRGGILDDPVLALDRRAELHEMAAERCFQLGDGPNGERERLLAQSYRRAALEASADASRVR